MEALSDDAMAILGAFFQMTEIGSTYLEFHMIKSKPSKRDQIALDELVTKQFISSSSFNKFGGIAYSLMRDFDRKKAVTIAQKSGGFVLTEPLTPTERSE